jgi:alpha-amylase
MKRLLFYCAILLASTTHAASPTVRNGGGEDIILQGFHWNSSRSTPEKWYDVLTRMAPVIGQDGFTRIWLPPVWADESSWGDPGKGPLGGR